MEKLVTLGIAAMFISIMLIFLGLVMQTTKPAKAKTEVRSAGVISISPFPFGWASDRQMSCMLVGVVVLFLLFYFLARR